MFAKHSLVLHILSDISECRCHKNCIVSFLFPFILCFKLPV